MKGRPQSFAGFNEGPALRGVAVFVNKTDLAILRVPMAVLAVSILKRPLHTTVVQVSFATIRHAIFSVVEGLAPRVGVKFFRIHGGLRPAGWRQGKQEDLDRAKTELEAAKSSLDEEQLKVVELTEKVRDLELQSAEENDEMILEANQVRSQYAKILEAMEKFNIKMSTDMKKLSEAKKKLNESASAL